MMEFYVYYKDFNSLQKLSDVPLDSIVHRVLSFKLSSIDLSDYPEYEEENRVKDNFIFLSKDDLEEIIKESLRTRNPIKDNYFFQRKYKFDEHPMTSDQVKFRMQLLKEEYEETTDAYEKKDAEEYVDGHIDLIVIALGNLSLAGVDVNKAWAEVYRANMSKKRGVKPGRDGSGGWDVYKPEGWKKPDHSDNHGDLNAIL